MPRLLLSELPEECWETFTVKFSVQVLNQSRMYKGKGNKSVTWFPGDNSHVIDSIITEHGV